MRAPRWLLFLICIAAQAVLAAPSHAQGRAGCPGGAEPSGVVVAVGGDVTARARNGSPFEVSVGTPLCPLDEIATGARSRVEFRLAGKDTTTGSSSNAITVVPAADSDCVTLLGGVLSFISSVQGRHCVRTPFVDAGIEGTEAVVAVDAATGDSFVLVRAGLVTVVDRRDPDERLALLAGQTDRRPAAFATRTRQLTVATPENVPAKFRDLLVRPDDATDWAIYYPPILLGADVDDPTVARAASLLEGGEPDAAEALLVAAPLEGRSAAAGLAIRAVAAIFRNDRAAGNALASEAVALAPDLGAAHIALSYALQAEGRVGRAIEAAEAAVAAAPGDAYAWARLAELQLIAGRRRAAAGAVERSLGIAETALARTIQGFAALASNQFAAGEAAFARAIALDSEAPLPRLGLGLAAIRQGRTADGRLEIETAVALDPRRASLRTWLGRAYSEEGRQEKAATQLALAQERDPDDPNAYLFQALTLFSENRPIEALRALDAAQERNEARSVVRSRRGLGEDLAVQGAATGGIYDLLGLEQRAIAEGARAVAADPTSPEAHRFLGTMFRTQRNSEIAQTSEFLKADLLSPPSKTPLQPRLVEPHLELLDTPGPTRVTFSEFGPLFDANGVRFDAAGIVGSQHTFGDELSVAALYNNVSIAAGQLYFQTDGYHANNDLEHQVYDVQLKLRPADGLTLFAEYRQRRSEAGERELNFDVDDFSPTFGQELDRDFFRIGLHGEPWDDTDILAVATIGTLETSDRGFGAFATDSAATQDDAVHLQGQGIHRFGDATLTLGASYANTDVSTRSVLTLPPIIIPQPPPLPPIVIQLPPATPSSDRKVDQYSLYGYVDFPLLDEVELTLGLSYDLYDDDGAGGIGRRQEVSPKLGLRITPFDGLQFRAAFARTVKPRLVSEQLLEPTSIMGFGQFLDITNGGVLEFGGVAVDAELTETTRAGAQAVFRRWDTPTGGTSQRPETEDFILGGYLQGSFGDRWSASLKSYHESAESEFQSDLDDFRLTTVSASARYFDPRGFFGFAEMAPGFHSFDSDGERGSDEFLMVNAAVGYRFPNERGIVSLEVLNLLDQRVEFQERLFRRDIFATPRFAPDLTVLARGTVRF